MKPAVLTVAQLIERLGQYSPDARVALLPGVDLPLGYAITGVASNTEFELAHLFDETAEPPDEIVLLLADVRLLKGEKVKGQPRKRKK